MKRYIAKTNVSINIVLASGVNRHITFSSQTGGGSVFYTDDPEIEKAMESHYKFGKLFRIDQLYMAEKTRCKPTKKATTPAPVPTPTPTPIIAPIHEEVHAPAAADEPKAEEAESSVEPTTSDAETVNNEVEQEADETEEAESESEYITVIVTDPDDAKAHLAEHLGISRTKLKKVETIKKIAAENGIVFQGI